MSTAAKKKTASSSSSAGGTAASTAPTNSKDAKTASSSSSAGTAASTSPTNSKDAKGDSKSAAAPNAKANQEKKAFYYQVSPYSDSKEQAHRIGTALFESMQPFIQKDWGLYRGNDPGQFSYTFSSWVQRVIKERKAQEHAVIAVSCHGQPQTGSFMDQTAGRAFRWTPGYLWFGMTIDLPIGRVLVFPGLRKLLAPLPADMHVDVVFAQCYGAYFADGLRNLVVTYPPANGVTVAVHGLSYAKTQRRIINGPTVSQIAYHKQLLAWFQGAHQPAAADVEDATDEKPEAETAQLKENAPN